MRVISGKARGMRLETPKDWRGRPTLDRVRESLFNILAPRLEDACFLDLYAGTGSNGIEALSRGACSCTFVETRARARECIRANLEKTQLLADACIDGTALPEGLARLGGPFDIVFADPPHETADYEGLLRGICQCNLLAAEGLVVIEHGSRFDLPGSVEGFGLTRRTKYGNSSLSFYSGSAIAS